MKSALAIFAFVLALGASALASAQTVHESGTIVRIDPQSSVVMLDDGRMYRVTPNTVFLVAERPAPFTALRTGERVVIQAGEPVVYRDGRYYTLQAPVVGQASPPTTVVAVPAGVRQTIYGVISDVDNDGKVKIKTNRDSFEARFSPEAIRGIKKGDNVVIDLTVNPPGAVVPR